MRGRPTIDPDGDKCFIHVQVTRRLKEDLAATAEESAVAPSTYARMILTNFLHRVLPRVSELEAEIDRLNILLAERSR